ncbi:EthD family reductase [bacterium]|nr:EthD family reductase [bacterium]
MFKFMLLFHQPGANPHFEDSYNDLLALIERMPGIQRRQVSSVVGSPSGASPYYRVLEVYYADRAALESSLLSAAGQEAGGQLAHFPAAQSRWFLPKSTKRRGAAHP